MKTEGAKLCTGVHHPNRTELDEPPQKPAPISEADECGVINGDENRHAAVLEKRGVWFAWWWDKQ
jgi:hypothetical protein